MARCPSCSGESFRVEEVETQDAASMEAVRRRGGEGDARIDDAVLVCATCGIVLGGAVGIRLQELRGDVQLLRDELNRLRQAVNFLNQRVR